MIAHIHKSGQTSWDKFVPSQETNYVVYHFLSVLKFWLNLFKTMPEWLLPWSIGQWPNRDNNEDQNSYLLFIRIWRLVAFPLWVSCWMAVIQITSQIYDNPHILAMLPLVQSCCLSLLIFNNKWFINWMSGFFLIVAAFSAIKKCSAYHFKKREATYLLCTSAEEVLLLWHQECSYCLYIRCRVFRCLTDIPTACLFVH